MASRFSRLIPQPIAISRASTGNTPNAMRVTCVPNSSVLAMMPSRTTMTANRVAITFSITGSLRVKQCKPPDGDADTQGGGCRRRGDDHLPRFPMTYHRSTDQMRDADDNAGYRGDTCHDRSERLVGFPAHLLLDAFHVEARFVDLGYHQFDPETAFLVSIIDGGNLKGI